MHLRAQWVAMRTIGRRIEAVSGQTAGGYPIYSVDTVSLVLPKGARHFRRLVPCAKCGQPVVDHSRPVHARSDLYREATVLCGRCSWVDDTSQRRRSPPDEERADEGPGGGGEARPGWTARASGAGG